MKTPIERAARLAINLLCVLLVLHPAQADKPYYFRSLEVEDGLSQNMVYCIMQDSRGFMWFGTQDGLNRYDGQNFRIYKKDPSDPKSVGSNGFFSMLEDGDGIIWIGTINGVYLYDPEKDSFSRLETATSDGTRIDGIARQLNRDSSGNIWIAVMGKGIFRLTPQGDMRLFTLDSGKASNIRDIEFDSEGYVWAATYGQGLFRLNPRTGESEQYLLTGEKSGNNDINDIFVLNDRTLLIGTAARGVHSFDLEKKIFSPFMEKDNNGQTLFVRRIFRNHKGEFWFCTETGVYIFNPQTRNTVNLRHFYNDPYSLSDNAVHCVYEDSERGMWLGTYFGGVNYISEFSSRFEKHYPIVGKNSISGKSISEFCQDDDGYIWIGTEDAGLNRFDPATQRFESGFIPATNIHALMYHAGKLWVGTFSEGLFVIELHTRKVHSYKCSSQAGSLSSDDIYAIYRDFSGTVWVGTSSGLHSYDPDTDSFIHIMPSTINSQVNDIIEDSGGQLWFATLGNGLFSYDRLQDRWQHYPYMFADNDTSGKMVSCLLEDSRQRLWVGTEGLGLCTYDRERDAFTNLVTTHDGLPNDVIYRLVEDGRGNIWGSTNKGLFQFDPDSNSVRSYTHANGLIGDQFNYKSGFRARDGKIYFGGIKGFVAFSAENLWPNEVVPPVVINSFQTYNREVPVGEGRRPLLERSIAFTDQVRIPYSITTFSIGFAALSYVSPRGNSYACKLEGWDKEWIHTRNGGHITYSNLPPGNYKFRVLASNSDGLWNKEGATLKVEILPPFYRTVWAYIAYVILGATALYIGIRLFLQRMRRRNEMKLREFEAQKEKELYNAKIEFFTNITHEIRTPLSLIKLPLEEIMKNMGRNDPNRDNLAIIESNANRLLKLVNELLDFRKAEARGLDVHFIHSDITGIVSETVERFMPSATLKGINLSLDLPEGTFCADVDAEMFTKIISNLTNNALNHAAGNIKVKLEADSPTFRLEVVNDGDRIAPEYAEKIFQPFFKIDESSQGSGIGLPFARSLAELHNGTLTLEGHPQGLTRFVIELPVSQPRVLSMLGHSELREPVGDGGTVHDIDEAIGIKVRSTVLVVEDNEEFVSFITGHLKSGYNVLKAADGKMGLEILEQNCVDIIISDIMMPVMDGMEFCRRVKEDLRYSHIPIILLTAKISIQSKMDGLRTGADEYIEKPFSTDYLKVRIENLLENRRKIVDSYKRSPEMALDTIAHTKADENFLNRLVDIIYQHIEEVDLDVDKLAASMNMSRATFYRKVKSISQLTPNDFIRLIRLKKAAELLRQREYRVNEIAFIVGFSSSSYFSKCFYKQFGVLPKDFEK